MAYKDYESYKRGKSALLYFHNRAVFYSDYKLTFEELITLLDSRTNNKYFVEGLGDGIILAEVPEFNVRAGMEKLATQGRGKIPATNGAFTQAIANNVSENISYVDAFAFVATESSKQIASGVAEGLQTVGNATIQGLETINFIVKYWYVTIPLGLGLYIMLNQEIKKRLA